MEIQIINSPFLKTRINRYQRSSSKTVTASTVPGIEIIVYNDEDEPFFITSIEIEYNNKKIPYWPISKSNPILVKEEYRKKVTFEHLISNYNVLHGDSIESLAGGKIIVSNSEGDTAEILMSE